MVNKLFKHEINSYLRILIPTNIIVLAIAVFTRILMFFRTDTVVFDVISSSVIVILVLATIAGAATAFILGIKRFYQNLFTKEGYLTFTLPVSVTQHLWVKLLVAIMFQLISFVVAAIAFCIATSGEFLYEVIEAAKYLINEVYMHTEDVHMNLYIVEVVILCLVSLVYEMLIFYSCITIGQRAKKNRVLMAVIVYFIYYVITQVFGTIFTIAMTIIAETPLYDTIVQAIENNLYTFFHCLFGGSTILLAGLSTVFFLVCRRIMSKKLNLE